MWLIAVGGILTFALVGFAQTTGEPAPPSPTFTVDPMNPVEGEPPIDASPSPGSIDPVLQPVVEFAQLDLAEQLGIADADIEVLEAYAVVWPDGGLGCPTPGMAYIQVQVEGALMRLRSGGKVYEYHSGGTRAPFLCEHPAPAPKRPGETPQPPPGGPGV